MNKPTKQDLTQAKDRIVPDVIDYDLKILFVGINPGLYTAAIGHHFGRPGNRFWKALHLSGFTPRLYTPFEDQQLLQLGLGITNLVSRASNGEVDLTRQEFKQGGKILAEKIQKYHPKWIAFLGIGAYQKAFGIKQVKIGRQSDDFEDSNIWVLPNPSGLNANYQLEDFARLFKELKDEIKNTGGR